jgi:hypothetical protein
VALPKFDEFKAPWETDAQGNPIAEADQVIDKGLLKKYLYNTLSDKEKAQIARDTARSENTELKTKVTELEGKQTGGESTGQPNDQIKQLMGLVQKLTEDNKKAEFKATKVEILSTKGFDPKSDMALFEGKDTPEAVEQYADLLVERGLGGKKPTEGENGGNGDEGKAPKLDGKPPVQLNNGLPGNGAEGDVDVDAFLKQYSSGNAL